MVRPRPIQQFGISKFSISVSADIAREMGRYYWLCHFPISAPLASLANIKIDFYDDME